MKWTDSLDIAIELAEAHPEIDPRTIRFTDLHRWVMELPEFDDDPNIPARKSSKRSRWRGSTKSAIETAR